MIGRTVEESSPAWPAPIRARDGAPNVLFFVLDDVGYGQLSCFGGLVETPNIDRVAASGLRYANMHTTALCSPTRSCILTGRNHHSSGVACIMELATGFPGYDGRMPFENGMLPEMLVRAGLQHVLPRQVAPVAVGGEHARRPVPPLAARPRLRALLRLPRRRDQPVVSRPHARQRPDDAARRRPRRATTSARTWPTRRSSWSSTRTSTRPRSRSSCTTRPGAAHAPHHVPKEWADRYKGRFDGGWDAYRETVFARQQEIGLLAADAKLSPRDPDVPEWASLSDDERRLYARMMEVFAGFVSHCDHHFGRILDTLEQIGELDNTLIMVISDNGASAEGGVTGSFNEMRFFNQVPESFEDNLAQIDELGGPESYNHYPWGWTWAGNTPFRRWKRETYRGGATDPFVARLAGRDGGARRGAHAVRARDRHGPDRARRARRRAAGDDPRRRAGAAGGRQLRAHLRRRRAPRPGTPRSTSRCSATARSTTTAGARSARGRGRASPRRRKLGRKLGHPLTPEMLDGLDRDGWELYDMARDPTETHNVAAEHPERCASWWRCGGRRRRSTRCCRWTARCRRGSRRSGRRPPSRAPASSTTRAARSCPAFAAPPVFNRPFSIEADVEIPAGGAEGVLVAQGGDAGGYVFYVEDGEAALPLQLRRPDQFDVESPAAACPRAGTRCATSSSRRASRTSAGKGVPGTRAALRRRHARRADRVLNGCSYRCRTCTAKHNASRRVASLV